MDDPQDGIQGNKAARCTDFLVKIPSANLSRLINELPCAGKTTISLSSRERPHQALAISEVVRADHDLVISCSKQETYHINPDNCHDCIVFLVESPLDTRLIVELTSPSFKLQGSIDLQFPVRKRWTHLSISLKKDDSLQVDLACKVCSLPKVHMQRLASLSSVMVELPRVSCRCESSVVELCDFCLLWYIKQEAPFVRAHGFDLVLIPRRGNFLDDFDGSSELHIGISCGNQIKEFNRWGVKRISDISEDRIWSECLPLRILESLQVSEIDLQNFHAQWAELFDKFASADDQAQQWTVATYNGDTHNCFDFALEFLSQFNRAINHKLFANSSLSRLDFCERFVVPRTREAAQYIDVHRKIWLTQ